MVQASELRCVYGDVVAVAGLDLVVHPGELLAVLGTNGAGKTTALDALEGRRPPDGGHVRVLGCDPNRQRRRLAPDIGVMLQEPALPDELTPAEFLALWHKMARGASPTRRPLDQQLTRVGLAHRGHVRIGRLSGGERRRLDLAVALSGDPPLLFLDEPTAGLDPESRADTWALIGDLLRQGTAIVLTTHYLDEADALADRLVILHEGHVEVAGTLDEVLAARASRIRCDMDSRASPPVERLAGDVRVTPHRGGQRLEVHTRDLTGDLHILLAWSQAHGVPLGRLHASEPSLAEVFADVRATATPEEVAS